MLTFYADDANKSSQHDYIHVAAYVGRVAQWEHFSVNWRLRLARAGLTEFHATKFFNGIGEFQGWNSRQREGKRTVLLRDLRTIIAQGSLFSFVTVIHVPSWQKVNAEYCLEEQRLRPYPLAGRSIVKQACQWWEARGHHPQEIQYIFDQGFEDWGMLCSRVEADLGIILHKENSRKVRPLQAADWLAYESSKEAPQYYDWEKRKRRPRDSLLRLLDLGSQPVIFNEKDLRKLCEDPGARIPKRI